MILALDIGLANTGWSVFDGEKLVEVGVIKTVKDKKRKVADDIAHRCMYMAKELRKLIYNYDVGWVIAELPNSGAKSAQALKSMVACSAVTATVIVMTNVRFMWATPIDVKKAVTGHKSAEKNEIMKIVTAHYKDFGKFPKYKNKLEHICDSIGVFWALKDKVNE
jgi:Holliday junction resolvasome RuvABC endonuclease subunit